MLRESRNVSEKAFEGKYLELLGISYSGTAAARSVEVPFVIGALVLLGRGEEAPVLYQNWAARLDQEQMWACRFFTMIHFVRAGQIEAAEKLRLEITTSSCTSPFQFFNCYRAQAFLEYFKFADTCLLNMRA